MSTRITVPGDLAGERADRIVAAVLGVSRRIAKTSCEEAGVTHRGEPVSASSRLAAGEEIEVRLVRDDVGVAPDPTVSFAIAYEDDDLLVVDKPPGVVVHPGAGVRGRTLVNGIIARRPQIEALGEERRWGVVHRIDRDTSGLLLVAKTPLAFDLLQAALKARAVKREYRTLVDGTFTNATGTIDAPVGRDPVHPTRRAVLPHGRPARTHYTRLADWARHDCTLLAVQLETGRTHQIRVHLQAIGHGVIGDPVYGPRRPTPGDPGRTWLHAERLTFDHPAGTGPMTVDAPLPPDLAASLASLGVPDRKKASGDANPRWDVAD